MPRVRKHTAKEVELQNGFDLLTEELAAERARNAAAQANLHLAIKLYRQLVQAMFLKADLRADAQEVSVAHANEVVMRAGRVLEEKLREIYPDEYAALEKQAEAPRDGVEQRSSETAADWKGVTWN